MRQSSKGGHPLSMRKYVQCHAAVDALMCLAETKSARAESGSLTGSCLDGAAAESFFATVQGGDRHQPLARPRRASASRDVEN